MVFTSVTSYLLVNLYFAESNPDDVLLLCDAEQVSKSTSDPDAAAVVVVVVCVWCCGANFKTTKRIVKTS